MPPLHSLVRLMCCWLLMVLSLSATAQTAALNDAGKVSQAPLLLHADSSRVDLWPTVSVFFDTQHDQSVRTLMDAPQVFAPPTTAHSTLGLRKEPVWFKVPLRVAVNAKPLWMLELDYAVLNRIDVYLVQNRQVLSHTLLGNLQTYTGTERVGRSHATMLHLDPGQDYELLVRVETAGAMIVPMTLNRPSTYMRHALAEQMLQGLMVGLSLCLVVYSLTNWFGLRDRIFLKYALLVLGGLLFSMLQFGVGAQFLWTNSRWMETHMAVISALISACAFFLFFEHVLAGPDAPRWFSPLMKTGAWLTVVFMVSHALDLINTQTSSNIVGILGIVPTLAALPVAVSGLRRGNTLGIYVVLGALLYFAAVITMTGVIFGRLPISFWTQHSVQMATLLDTVLLMRLLSLRSREMRRAAEQASEERDAMRSLAHADPLTGLPNRRGLNTALTAALPHSGAGKFLAVFVLDLDGFKPINDQYGHDVGDELLVAVAQRLQHMVRSSDIVARVGGDEFVVMASGLHKLEQASELGHKLLEAFHAPFQLTQHRCKVGLTIGYALAPLDGNDAKTLLKLADASMYQGKQDGKHCLRRLEHGKPGLTMSELGTSSTAAA
ncbi:diguanylate cyclase domain-containing protein [Variovorax sp. HJSM1_2]|uniref:diguanylate cyclase domain-containing protein n=1 Tax=Variovorax sp. HJSM1_2 TaxID=3366263 RepID=UPI003BEE89CC